MSIPDWLDTLGEDRDFAGEVWDCLIWLNDVEVVGLNMHQLAAALKRRYYKDVHEDPHG